MTQQNDRLAVVREARKIFKKAFEIRSKLELDDEPYILVSFTDKQKNFILQALAALEHECGSDTPAEAEQGALDMPGDNAGYDKWGIWAWWNKDKLKSALALLDQPHPEPDNAGALGEIDAWMNKLNLSISKGLIEDIASDVVTNETTLQAKKNRQLLLRQSGEALSGFIRYFEKSALAKPASVPDGAEELERVQIINDCLNDIEAFIRKNGSVEDLSKVFGVRQHIKYIPILSDSEPDNPMDIPTETQVRRAFMSFDYEIKSAEISGRSVANETKTAHKTLKMIMSMFPAMIAAQKGGE